MLTANAIAAYYGVPARAYRRDIKACLEQAREMAGHRGFSHWALFDHYFGETVACDMCASQEASYYDER